VGVILSEKFDRALHYIAVVHAGQTRNRSDVPLLAHLLGVASIALEYGASEDEAIAALLHDSAEQGGGTGRLEDIRQRFGENVAKIVEACTDSAGTPTLPWRARKATFIARLPHASNSVRLVCASEKLQNARKLLQDLRAIGSAAWEPVNGGKETTLWYYRCLVQAFKTGGVTPLIEELDRTVVHIEQIAKQLEIEIVLPDPAPALAVVK
jgi:(p)ppGpp synthase/HD superfamily hydrolase